MWQLLRRKQRCGMKFRREHPLGIYLADFYCHEAKLVVELDGSSHDSPETKEYDLARDRWMRNQGIRVLRFTCSEVQHETDRVVDEIDDALRNSSGTKTLSPNPSLLKKGEGSNSVG